LSTWLAIYQETPQWLPLQRRDPALPIASAVESTNRIAYKFLTSFHVADPERFRFRVVIGGSVHKVSWSEELQEYRYQAVVPAISIV